VSELGARDACCVRLEPPVHLYCSFLPRFTPAVMEANWPYVTPLVYSLRDALKQAVAGRKTSFEGISARRLQHFDSRYPWPRTARGWIGLKRPLHEKEVSILFIHLNQSDP